MSEEASSQIVPAAESALIVPREDGNVSVTALQPDDMQASQQALIAWAQQKVVTMRAEAVELRAAYEHARDRKWKSDTLKRHAVLAEKRVTFYEKVLAALEAGFVIIPNFPVALFAIRTIKKSPVGRACEPMRYYLPKYEQTPEQLPVGEGEYRNPFPYVCEGAHYMMEGKEHVTSFAGNWKDFEFPVAMAKPNIMAAADRTMALKIFDQLGVLPAESKQQVRVKGDPIIVGQLVDPRDKYSTKLISFMVAWHIDTRSL